MVAGAGGSGDLARALEGVGRAAAVDAGGIDLALLGDFLHAVVDAAGSGRQLRRTELQRCADAGRRAASEGVALRAVVDLHLSAAWRVWRDVPEVTRGDATRVRSAGLAVLRAADDGVAALAEGYQLARADLARLRESARHDVMEALLAGGPQAVEASAAAADLGLVLSGPVAVLVARSPDGFGSPATAGLPGRIERALQGRHGDAQPLVLIRSGELVCAFSAPDALAVDAVRHVVVEEVDGRLRAAPRAPTAGGPWPWRGAVSSPRTGAGGVRASYEEATYALELAERMPLAGPVVDARDLAVYRVLLRDRPAAHDLVRGTLGPLAHARGGVRLLETLDAYYSSGCVATETAARLHLSVRTVTYRLARAADLLGRNPSDPAERFTLQAAVTAARLLDWPATPLPD
jgi:sugar diacid utilization regulator